MQAINLPTLFSSLKLNIQNFYIILSFKILIHNVKPSGCLAVEDREVRRGKLKKWLFSPK